MIIYDLTCSAGHAFEGWFGGSGEFERERKAGRLSCPACGDSKVHLVPSGGHVGSSATRKEALPPAAPPRKSFLAALAEAVERNFEDVGPRFPEEARKIHWGEAEGRNIRGSMTPEEERELVDDGVEFHKIPLPRFQG